MSVVYSFEKYSRTTSSTPSLPALSGLSSGATPRVTPKIAGSSEENIESMDGSVHELCANACVK